MADIALVANRTTAKWDRVRSRRRRSKMEAAAPTLTYRRPMANARKEHSTNLRKLTPSRKRLIPGDIFLMQPADELYLFGRVIRTDVDIIKGGQFRANLIYVYNYRSSSPELNIAALSRDDLLTPPKLINRLGWSRGYMMTVANRPLSPDDVLPRHCFRDLRFGRPIFVDDYLQPLAECIEPCGHHALSSYVSLDYYISQALGLPLMTD